MKFKLYKNYKILIIIFMCMFIVASITNQKEGINWRSFIPPPPPRPPPLPRPSPPRPVCQNCSSFNIWNSRCESYCQANQTCVSGHRCVCSDGYHWANSRCEKCPNGQYWNGSSCVCPSGQNWNGRECITCKPGQIWQNNNCVCQPYQRLKADGSSCIDVCEKTSVWNGNQCVCPDGKKWIVSPTESGCK